MLVGDAAHHVNPVTGGGITSGMTAGWIAGQVAADSIRKDDTSEKQLRAYPEWVHKEFGKKYEFHRYAEAGHGFLYYDRPLYHQSSAIDAWEKIFTFLRTNL